MLGRSGGTMKETVLRTLVCPRTLDSLSLTIFVQEDDEVLEGALSSPQVDVYPIIRGVPRMLRQELRQHLPTDYPEYFAKYTVRLNALVGTVAGCEAVRRQ